MFHRHAVFEQSDSSALDIHGQPLAELVLSLLDSIFAGVFGAEAVQHEHRIR